MGQMVLIKILQFVFKGFKLNEEKAFFDNCTQNEDKKRIKRINEDFLNAFCELKDLPPAVSIFGSARVPKDSTYYKKSEELSKLLSNDGYAIITGGSGGIMEAANKGANISVGLRINLKNEQKTNEYVKKEVPFQYFFARKVNFLKYANALVYFPGGFGTLDEFFEALCLIQTKKISPLPMVLFGSEYFNHLYSFFEKLAKDGYISKKDLDLFIITDSVEDAFSHIQAHISIN
jgi:uncharacterized protein (TIGR00730 family)